MVQKVLEKLKSLYYPMLALGFSLNMVAAANPVSTFLNNIKDWILIAIMLVALWKLVKDGLNYSKGTGNASIVSIVVDLFLLVLLVGGAYYLSTISSANSTAFDTVNDAFNEAIGK